MAVPSDTFSFSWEWEPAGTVLTPELSATFARLNINVGDEDVTLVEDRSTGSSRRSIYVPLYSLAEWIAYNWWNLLYDARPGRDFLGGVDPRHSMRSSGDGFLWPNLSLLPEGRTTRVVWRGDGRLPPAHPTRYLTSGEYFVDSEVVVRELVTLVEAVIGRLREMDVKGTQLEIEWTATRNLDAEELEFCIAAARLGLDPLSDGAKYEEHVVRAAESLGGDSMLQEFLGSVTIADFDASLAWVMSGLEVVRREGLDADQPARILRRIVGSATTPSFDHPWRVGWHQAALVRRVSGVDVGEPFALEPYLREVSMPVPDRALVAVGQAGDDASPVVVLGRGRLATSRRFTMARALWRQVAAPSGGSFLISNAYSELQRVERAFAAELLAPAEGVAGLLDVDPADAQHEDLEMIAERFGVSTVVVQHQLENQLLGRT